MLKGPAQKIANGAIHTIDINDIARDASSYVDPQGFLFHHEGGVYRFIKPQAASLFERLFSDGTLKHLEQKHGLVPTELSEIRIAGREEGLIFRHENIWPLSYCVEWCPSMLQDAGRVTLDIALDLVDRDLMLQDAYPWNILYSGSRPVFVDLTSIAPTDQGLIWPAQDQFEAFFLRPLTLAAEKKGRASRALLLNNINGIELDDFYYLVSPAYRYLHPGLGLRHWLDRRLQHSAAIKNGIRQMTRRVTAHASPEVRRRFFDRLCRRLMAYSSKTPRRDPWTRYYDEMDASVNKDVKLEAVKGLLAHLRPKTVLDLGCNTGVFSLLAAEAGSRVISVDSNESCIELLYRTAKDRNLPITPLICDAACPTPPFGFMGCQYPGIWERVKSDMVLCLGLMHHLIFTGRQSLERIVELVATVARHYLIFEYVGLDDRNIPHLSQRRKVDYRLEAIDSLLSKHFGEVDIRPSDRESRRLLICKR